jgi:UDP-glucose 4-epimerase
MEHMKATKKTGKSRKKTIFVTGGAGFIASHIVDAYLEDGHRVIVVDDLSTGFRKNVNKKAKFYKADIKNFNQLSLIFKKEKPQIVSHHAAVAEVSRSLRDPVHTFATNVDGIVNLLRCAGEAGISRFIFASTGGAVYGEPAKIPAKEETPTMPLSPYGLTKLIGEECIQYYARHYGFSYTIFRYTNVYGPRQNPKGEAGVIAIFGGLMKAGKQPVIFGDGTKIRDYLFVGDVVRANKLALSHKENHLMNLGWGNQVRDREIFDAIAKIVGFKGEPIFEPFRKGEVYKITIDSSRAKKAMGWKPNVKLKEGLRRTINAI